MGYKLKNKKSEEPQSDKFTRVKMIKEVGIYDAQITSKLFKENKSENLDGILRHSLDYTLWTGNAIKHISSVVKDKKILPKADAVLEIYIIFHHIYGMPKEKAFESALHIYGHLQEAIDDYAEKSGDGVYDRAGTIAFFIAREAMKHIGVDIQTEIVESTTDDDLM